MKILKFIGIAILCIIAIVFGPALVAAFGTCAFLGFIIIGGLDAAGLIKVNTNDFNTLALISFALGLFIFIVYSSIVGWPTD